MKHLVPIHVANYVGSPGTVQSGFKKFYLKNGYYKLYDGVNEDDLVLDRPLDNYTPLPGTITAADSVLTALEKLDYAISNFVVPTGSLQDVVNVGNVINNFGGAGVADIRSVNFTNDRTLYLNNNSFATIKIEDNLNAAHYVIIDIDTINLNGTSYNWSTIVSGGTQDLQQVTDLGNTTTNPIIISNTSGISYFQAIAGGNSLTFQIDDVFGTYIEMNDISANKYSYISSGGISFQEFSLFDAVLTGEYLQITNLSMKPYIYLGGSDGTLTGYAFIKTDLLDSIYYQQLPPKDGTFAMLDDIPSYTIPTLDQVLNEGYIGIDKSILLDTSTNVGYASLNYNQLVVADADYAGSLGKQTLIFNSNLSTTSASYGVGSIGFSTSGSTATNISFENPTGLNSIVVPDKSGTLATLDDIPSGSYLPLAGGTMDASANIFFANGSKLSEGAVDAGTGGSKGIALTCSVGYEFKWEAGEGYITDLTFNVISSKIYARFTPTPDDDSTKGYGYYSYWNTAIGGTYRCIDATPGAAVWEEIHIFSNFVPYTGAANNVDLGAYSLKAGSLVTQTNGPTKSMTLNSGNLNTEHTAEWQDKDYIGIADITDIPTNTSQLTNDGADGVNPFITAADIPATGIQHATASGTDTYTATIAGVTSYSDADAYLIRFTNGNTTGATLNINSLGARPLYRNNDGPLLGGDVGAGGEMLCVYNSTTNVFQCIGTAPNSLFAYITNDDSVTITKGMPVYAFSGTGDRMTVKRANNSSDATSAQTVGLVLSTSIAPNQKGFILMQGLLDGLSILPTATWSDGDAVYLGATAGTITNVKPYAPNHLVYLGVVTTASNGAAGRLYVRVQNGFELQELHNVDLISNAPTNNQLLTYESATSLWKNKNLTDILETFNRTQGIYFFEDFMGSLTANITTATTGFVTGIGNGQGTLRSTSTITNRTNQQGVVEALTSANATGTAGYYYANGVYKGSGAISIETYINFTTLSVLGERFLSLFGFYTGVNYLNPPNFIVITYDEGGSLVFENPSPNFKCVSRSASGTRTTTITSIPVVAGQWYRLRINISNDGSTVTFFINNALVGTHSTNIPTNATFLPVGCMLQKTSGVAARAMQTDYFMYEEIFTTPR